MKKRQSGFTTIELIITLCVVFVLIPWFVDVYKLCFVDDWKAPYRAEAIHATGALIPPLSPVTVWANDSK